MAEDHRLEIHTLGGLRLLLGGEPIAGLRLRKAQALLVYLAMHAEPQPRELLATLFWGEMNQVRAMANLRDSLHHLRKHLQPFLRITRNDAGLNPEAPLWLDALAVQNSLTAASDHDGAIDPDGAQMLGQGVQLYRGDFLQGFHLRGAPDFENWLVVEREQLRQAVLEALSALVEFHLAQADYTMGIRYARRLLQLDPLMEEGQRQLMRLLAAGGQPGSAIAAYQSYQQMLKDELGVEPTGETRALYEKLLRGETLPGIPSRPRHNLPGQSTSFIGREQELEEISRQLQDPACRLLTLVGVGGIGKSRLALKAAENLVDSFSDGVWHVELAALSQGDLLAQEVAAALGVGAQEVKGERQVIDVLVEFIKEKQILLVLDNCEHLIEASASLIDRLLGASSQLKIIATSRESIEVRGEKIFQVPALEVPSHRDVPEQLENFAGVKLFVDRANAVRPGFRLTEDNSKALVEISRSLDGLPLAIELAAARVRMLSLLQIADRLKDRFQLLTGGPRTAPPRSQTLRASMDWSYGLLSELERTFLRKLSVFSGGWSLEAAEKIGGPGEGASQGAFDLLSQLVDKSLVMAKLNRHTARYHLLEMVRQYGAEKLSEAGEALETRRLHAVFFTQLAEAADPQLRGPEQVDWLETLDLEHDNLRSALDWCIREEEADLAHRLVGALGWYWFMRGYWAEAQVWLEGALSTGESSHPLLRAKAVYRVRALEIIRGNLKGNVFPVEEALAICQEHSDQEGIAWCLNLLGQAGTWRESIRQLGRSRLSESKEIFEQLEDTWGVAWSLRYLAQMAELFGDSKEAILLHEAALTGFEKAGDAWSTAHSLFLMGNTHLEQGDHGGAKRAYERCLVKCEDIGDQVMVAHALRGLGEMALREGDSAQAVRLFQEALEVFHRMGDEYCYAQSHRGLGMVALRGGELDQAKQLLRKSLRGFQKLRIQGGYLALTLGEIASLAELMGDAGIAARLLAAAEASLEDSVYESIPFYKEQRRKTASSLTKRLGQEEFDLVWQSGSSLSLEQAVGLALNSEVDAERG